MENHFQVETESGIFDLDLHEWKIIIKHRIYLPTKRPYEDLMIFQGNDGRYVIAFKAVNLGELGHDKGVISKGHLCENADQLVTRIETFKGLRLDQSRLMLEEQGVNFTDIKAAMRHS